LVKDGFLSLEAFTQYRFDGVLDVPKSAATKLVKGDEFTSGLGLALERHRWKLDGALSYVKQNYSNVALPSDDYMLGTVRGAIRVRDWLWLEASAGTTSGRNFGNDPFFSVNIKIDTGVLKKIF
jgi:hypothetical protein